MKQIVISDRAARSFRRIATYSNENFGARRGEQYARSLTERCAAVARGDVSGRSCGDFFALELQADLRFVAVGSHYVIYRETVRQVVIIDFIHQSADVGGRLGGAPP